MAGWPVSGRGRRAAPGAPEPCVDEDQGEHAVRGLISPGRGERERAHLVVLDVPVNLRAIDPIGTSQVWATLTSG
ncbi:hypothetical protein PVK74_30505 [Micromonospora chalcea]|uniref:hypothetical protein n=1 Tax=Micromonospora chalcea TaxID=1874 RepID=UPI002378BD66|nr:hypothetical protein [Micromonospora chalcea]WDQ00103.1 hypothetical protein PVK74_30505 [Micromonospora chalcea]